MLDFRVDTFLAVCRHMNFTRAAEELHITQPAVSQHVHWLEQDCGARFFAYEGKKLRLTEAGAMFLSAATTMKHDAIYLRDTLKKLPEGRQALRFGATLSVGEYVMPGPIARLLERMPELRLRMVVGNTRELLRRLDEGELDCAVVEGFFEKTEYEHLRYETARYVAVCAPDYGFARPVRVLEDLLGERLLLREPGSGTRALLERLLEERNLTTGDFRRVVEIGSLGAIKALARAGCGVAFLYEPTVRAELAEGSLREIALQDLHARHDFTFLWRKNSVFAAHYHETFAMLGGVEE